MNNEPKIDDAALRNARLALAQSSFEREQRLFDARVTARQDLEGAQAALAGREGCAVHAIGMWPGDMPDHRTGAGEIAAWALRQALDAVVLFLAQRSRPRDRDALRA